MRRQKYIYRYNYGGKQLVTEVINQLCRQFGAIFIKVAEIYFIISLTGAMLCSGPADTAHHTPRPLNHRIQLIYNW